jgi:hypothetical protein
MRYSVAAAALSLGMAFGLAAFAGKMFRPRTGQHGDPGKTPRRVIA